MSCTLSVLLVLAATGASSPTTPNDTEIATLGAALAVLRADVEGLAADVDTARAEAKEEQLALARRRAALDNDVETARLTRVELVATASALEASTLEQRTAADDIARPLRTSLAAIRGTIERSAPFQQRARLARIDDVGRVLDAEGPVRALEALGPVIAEEAKLARTTQRAKQSITVDGETMMADVIRLGTVAVLFRTPTGSVGSARRLNGAVTWQVLASDEDRALVRELFDLHRAQAPARVVRIPFAVLEVTQ